MTVIRPNSISGITSITGQGGDISIFRADGTTGDLVVNNVTTGIITATTFVGNLTGNPTGSGANLTNLPAGNLTGNLPAISAANLTSIPAANITGTLPAISAANLTNVPAANITGTLPAIDGSNLTGVGASFGNSSVNTSGIITATAFVSTNQNLSHRNKIINGSQQIFQRGTSAQRSGGNDGYYNGIADRWAIRMHSSVAQTLYSQDTSDNPHGFGSNQKSVRSNAGSSSSSKYYVYDTKLEGQDLQDFAKGTSSAKEFTLSFYVKTGVSGVYCIELRDLDNARMVGGTYTVSNGNWNRYVITFPADTTGAFGNDNGASLWVRFWLAAGSNFTSGTARTAWASGAPDSVLAAGQTAQVGDNVADLWQITGIQLEVGSVATPFEHRTFAEELERCKRYFQKDLNRRAYWGSGNVSDRQFPVRFGVEMRDTPTVSFTSTSLDGGSAAAYNKTRQGYNFAMTGNGRFYEWAHEASAELG